MAKLLFFSKDGNKGGKSCNFLLCSGDTVHPTIGLFHYILQLLPLDDSKDVFYK